MQHTKIEWADYTINPVKGLCPMDCKDNQGKSYCYARAMYKRFKWNPEIRFDASPLMIPIGTPWQSRSKFFVGSTMELFGDWVKPEWMEEILTTCKVCSEHIFIFLTKQPQNLLQYSPFPDNCFVGVSATDKLSYQRGMKYLAQIGAKVHFISFEPLLSWDDCLPKANGEIMLDHQIDWVIIGQKTPIRAETTPKIEWVKEITVACDKAGIPIFLKNNLKPLLKNNEGWTPAWAVSAREPDGSNEYLRQEIPLTPTNKGER